MHRRFLLDTTVLIDISKKDPEVYRRLGDLLEGGEAGVCAVSVAEFMTGIPPNQRAWMAHVIDQFTYWDMTREAAEVAGTLRYDLARRGIVLHLPDSLIAGLARTLDATVVTDNVKDFAHAGIRILRLRG